MSPTPAVLIIDGNPERLGLAQTLSELMPWAVSHGHRVAVPVLLKEFLTANASHAKGVTLFDTDDEVERILQGFPSPRRLVLSLGGDGSVLHAVGRFWRFDLPIMGVNLGTVGFNASILPRKLIEALNAWEAGQTRQDEHMLARARHLRGGAPIEEAVALNDVVLQREPRARILQFEARQGDSLVLACYGDGLLVTTPTGSTAYNLSAGGPIVHPSLAAFILTTLGAHTLSSRAIVLPPLSLKVLWRTRPSGVGPAMVIDGSKRWTLEEGDEVEVAREPQSLKLVHLPDANYFQTLREKLHWALPIRQLEPDP
jgi:NAD+ kinase